ncbi:aldo/keto reductase [Streptomyces xanthochromogenes]|uniref:aldo/keto reductase n=1 Tax=Streptomyces xanthochromogenes TaxID=67384 RepID=UPI00342DBC23
MNASLALGTYRIPGEELAGAARRAAGSPSAWIDTAPNYCQGRAHRLLAPVLADHPRLHVATKAGFLTSACARAARAAGAIPTAEVRHSIAAEFVRWQTARSRTELGRNRLDAMLLHNPEHRRQDQQDLARQMRAAFAVLEEAASAAEVAAYGVATWNGFTHNAFTVPQLDRLAREAAGSSNHHLRVLQLPVSLVMDTHLDEALAGHGPITQAADRGWEVQASAPLHGGELLTLATPEIADLITAGTGVAAACLAATASCPGLGKVLLATSRAAHWDDALTVTGAPTIPPATLRTVLDVLAAPL